MHSTLSSTTLLVGVLATSVLATPQYGDSGSTSASMTASASSSSATNIHSVTVGPGLVFTPDTITAAQGDYVEFTFGAGHNVAQSSFDAPCMPIGDNAIYSGNPNDGDVWKVMINSTDPLWLYCSVPGHCKGGMAMVVNPPSSGNTLDAYKSAASGAQASTPATVQGGTFGAISDSGSSSSSAGSSSQSSTATQSSTASSTGSAATSTHTGAASSTVSNGLMFLGALAAGVAAML